MNKNNQNLASEIITDMQKHIVLLDGRMESLNEDIEKIKSMFRAVHYSIAEGAILGSEADAAMSGIQTLLNILADNFLDTLGMSNKYVSEIES